MSKYPRDADGDALRRVAESGNDMSAPMDVDIQIAAADESTAQGVAERAEKMGYRTSIYFDAALDDAALDDAAPDDDVSGEPLWTCNCTKSMVLTYDAIIAAQAELDAIAKPLGAYSDGWGTFGNAPTSPPAASPWWKFW